MSFFSDRLIKNLEKELKAKPSSKCFSVLAQIHYGQGDFKKAEELCLDGLKYHPSHIPALLLLAEIYISLEKRDQASSYLNRAQILAPDHLKIYEKLAILYTKQNQLEKTIEAYKTLLVLMPDHPTALNMLSYLEPFAGSKKPPAGEENLLEKKTASKEGGVSVDAEEKLHSKKTVGEKTDSKDKTISFDLVPKSSLKELSFGKARSATETASGLEEPSGRVKDKSLKQSRLKKQKLLKLNQMLARVENYIEKSGI